MRPLPLSGITVLDLGQIIGARTLSSRYGRRSGYQSRTDSWGAARQEVTPSPWH